MPKTAKLDESDKAQGKVHQDLSSNEFTETVTLGFLADIERTQSKIDAIKAAATTQCQPHIDHIKELKKEAAECGLEKKAFNAALMKRGLLRKAEHAPDSLSEKQRDNFEKIDAHMAAVGLDEYRGDTEA